MKNLVLVLAGTILFYAGTAAAEKKSEPTKKASMEDMDREPSSGDPTPERIARRYLALADVLASAYKKGEIVCTHGVTQRDVSAAFDKAVSFNPKVEATPAIADLLKGSIEGLRLNLFKKGKSLNDLAAGTPQELVGIRFFGPNMGAAGSASDIELGANGVLGGHKAVEYDEAKDEFKYIPWNGTWKWIKGDHKNKRYYSMLAIEYTRASGKTTRVYGVMDFVDMSGARDTVLVPLNRVKQTSFQPRFSEVAYFGYPTAGCD